MSRRFLGWIATSAVFAFSLGFIQGCGSDKYAFQNDPAAAITSVPTSGSAEVDIATSYSLQRVNFILAHNTSAGFVRFKSLINQALDGFLQELKLYPVLVSTLSLNKPVNSTTGNSLASSCIPPFIGGVTPSLSSPNQYFSCKNNTPATPAVRKLEFNPSDSIGDFNAKVLTLKEKIANAIGDPSQNSSTRIENVLSLFSDPVDPVLDGGISIAVVMSHTDYPSSENTTGAFLREYTPQNKTISPASREVLIKYNAVNSSIYRDAQVYKFDYRWQTLTTEPSGNIIFGETPTQSSNVTCTISAPNNVPVLPANPVATPAATSGTPAEFCPAVTVAASATEIPCTAEQVSYLSRRNNNALIITSGPNACKLVSVGAFSRTGGTMPIAGATLAVPIVDGDTAPATCADPIRIQFANGTTQSFASVNALIQAPAGTFPSGLSRSGAYGWVCVENPPAFAVQTKPPFYSAGSTVKVAYAGATGGSGYAGVAKNLAQQLLSKTPKFRAFVLGVDAAASASVDCLGEPVNGTPNLKAAPATMNTVSAGSSEFKSICVATSLKESLQKASDFIQAISGRVYKVEAPVNSLSVTSVSVKKPNGTIVPLVQGPGDGQYQWSLISGSIPSRAEIYIGSLVDLPAPVGGVSTKLLVNYSGTIPL